MAQQKVRVFDCFPFLDELDILEIRLDYLRQIVDVVVIAQDFFTHRGNRWIPILNFEHKLIKKFSNKCEFRFTKPSQYQKTLSPWEREKNQRNSLNLALHDIKNNDLVMISDVDEIPSIESIIEMSNLRNKHKCSFKMKNAFTFSNTVSGGYWRHAKIIRGEYFISAQVHREEVLLPTLRSCGLHLSVMGKDRWYRKFEISPHQEIGRNLTPNLVDAFVELRMYPSIDNIKLWSGGRLKNLDSKVCSDILAKVREHKSAWINENTTNISYLSRINLSVIAYLSNSNILRINIPLEKRDLKVSDVFFQIFFLLIYLAFFPLRIWSYIYRKFKLRSRLKLIISKIFRTSV